MKELAELAGAGIMVFIGGILGFIVLSTPIWFPILLIWFLFFR